MSDLNTSTKMMLIAHLMIRRNRTQRLFSKIVETIYLICFVIPCGVVYFIQKIKVKKKIVPPAIYLENERFHFNDYVLLTIIGFNVSFPFSKISHANFTAIFLTIVQCHSRMYHFFFQIFIQKQTQFISDSIISCQLLNLIEICNALKYQHQTIKSIWLIASKLKTSYDSFASI